MSNNDKTDVSDLGTIMGIWAHPDDEVIAMGGIFAQAGINGQKTICITATRGEKGVQDESRWPQSRLAEIRTKEMQEAIDLLGINYHHWLDYPDGGCGQVDTSEAATKIAKFIEHYKPDSIFTFGPDGMTGHDDHRAMSLWASMAAKKAKSKAVIYHCVTTPEAYEALMPVDAAMNMFFNINKPCICISSECDVYLELNKEILTLKIEALKAMPSQLESMILNFEESIREGFCHEAFVRAED